MKLAVVTPVLFLFTTLSTAAVLRPPGSSSKNDVYNPIQHRDPIIPDTVKSFLGPGAPLDKNNIEGVLGPIADHVSQVPLQDLPGPTSKLMGKFSDLISKQEPVDKSTDHFRALGEEAKRRGSDLSTHDQINMLKAVLEFSQPALKQPLGDFGEIAVSKVKTTLARAPKAAARR